MKPITCTSTRDVIIQTENLAAAVRFYKSVLGLNPVRHSKTLVGFETGAFCLYVEQGPAPGPVFEFCVPDLAAAKKRLVAAGCTVVDEDPELPRCYLRDPHGLTYNLAEREA